MKDSGALKVTARCYDKLAELLAAGAPEKALR